MSKKAISALIEASRMGDLAKVKMLVNAGVEVDATDDEMNMTPLHHATERGHLEVCQYLLTQGADIQARAVMGHTPFTLACCQGLFPVVKWLLASGSSVEEADDAGFTGLHGASRHGHLDTVMLLVAAGANINMKSNQGYTPLFYACRGGHLPICEFLHAQGANLHLRTNSGNSLLTFTCYNGHLPVIKWLVDSGCDVNESDNHGETGLHRACQTGDINIVQYLVSRGADVNRKSKHGKTPLHLAAENNRLEVYKFMLFHKADLLAKDSGGESPLTLATSKGHLDIWLITTESHIKNTDMVTLCAAWCGASTLGNLVVVKHLLEHGVIVDTADRNGYTALHHAIPPGHLYICEYLHSKGLGLEVKTTEGHTPLMSACYHGQLHIVKWLISYRVDINLTDNNGYTAIHHATSRGHLELCDYLHSKGLLLSVKITEGYTPLMAACSHGQLDIVQWLIVLSDDMNVTDDNGLTALHHAAKQGHLEVCKHLHFKGAELNTTDKDGNTLLMDASNQGSLTVVKWLVQNGCDVLQTNLNGGTALTLALEKEHKEVAMYLVEHLIDTKKLQSIIKTKPNYQETNRIITQLGEEVIKLQTQLGEQQQVNAYLSAHINALSGHDVSQQFTQVNVAATNEGQIHSETTQVTHVTSDINQAEQEFNMSSSIVTALPEGSTSDMEPANNELMMISSADSAYSSQPEITSDSTPGSFSESDIQSPVNSVGQGADVIQLTGQEESEQTTLSAVLLGEDGGPVSVPPGVRLVPIHASDTTPDGVSNMVSGYVVQNTVTRSVKMKESTYSDTVISVDKKKNPKEVSGNTEFIKELKVQNKSLQNKVKDLEGQLRTKDSKHSALHALKIMERSTIQPFSNMPPALQASSTLTHANEELAKYIRQADINNRVLNAHSATHLTLMLLREKYSEDQLKDHSAVGAGKSNRPSLDKNIIAAITGFVQSVYPGINRSKLIGAINQACSDARKRGKSKSKGSPEADEVPSKRKAEDKDT